jgi:alkylation response protein AidB-like acyl-CoA dehydrogenase
MDFGLTEDQREIQRTARELLGERARWETVREHAEQRRTDEALWQELCTLGWPGIAVAEEYGGQGLGQVELSILCEELGRTVAPVPFLPTVLAATLIEQAGSEQQRRRWLPGLASGEAVGAVGEARDGIAELVLGAAEAQVVVLLEADAARVIAVGETEVTPLEAIDPTRSAARVSAGVGVGEALDEERTTDIEGVSAGLASEGSAGLADGASAGHASGASAGLANGVSAGHASGASAGREGGASVGLDRALIAIASELVGVCERALAMTVEYVKERRQFGVPVGSYQAVSHRCAQMLLETEKARATAAFAAWTADADPARLAEAAAMAKAAAGDAGREVTASAIQAHGGIGFTWEANVHWLYKRAQLDAALLGGAKHHRARLAGLLSEISPAAVPT